MTTYNSPLSDPSTLDVVGQRIDGGVDLIISCSGDLDESDETIGRLSAKVRNYLVGATHPNFGKIYPAALRGPTRILVSTQHAISAKVSDAIRVLAVESAQKGVELLVEPTGA